ncbi:MAG: ATP-dependent DNA ligase [Sulfitobacter sp.]
MRRFTALCETLDRSTKTAVKVTVLAQYFTDAEPVDKLWTIALLSGRRPKRVVTAPHLRDWALEVSQIPLWLFEDSFAIVGDLAETTALILPHECPVDNHSLSYWINEIREISNVSKSTQKALILETWQQLGPSERVIFNKLLTGSFRQTVSPKLMTTALSQATGIPDTELAHRLSGNWHPDDISWHILIEAENASLNASRPYPFCLASPLETPSDHLGSVVSWQAEWKRHGIRCQLILRDGTYFVWTKDHELMTDQFPELAQAIDHFPPGTVLDGEVLIWPNGADKPNSFNALKSRTQRKTPPKKLLADAPAVLLVSDLLEWQGQDIRSLPLARRREFLEDACAALPTGTAVRLSAQLPFETWPMLNTLRDTARSNHAQGLILKHADSPYAPDGNRGDWREWGLDPLSITAVMIYAHSGIEQGAAPFTEFTFAVWNEDTLVPFTKAGIGLNDKERSDIATWVKKNTQQRFGPVRQVNPHLVFEIAFDGIQVSKRHKSGVVLQDTRIKRWRHDTPPSDAQTLDDLNEMLRIYG